ncbi:hypothetical protein Slin14017_G114540 [Septoria linicola]|nr:hypothetical protein Slin14017_G114540 [Septoria linicola]
MTANATMAQAWNAIVLAEHARERAEQINNYLNRPTQRHQTNHQNLRPLAEMRTKRDELQARLANVKSINKNLQTANEATEGAENTVKNLHRKEYMQSEESLGLERGIQLALELVNTHIGKSSSGTLDVRGLENIQKWVGRPLEPSLLEPGSSSSLAELQTLMNDHSGKTAWSLAEVVAQLRQLRTSEAQHQNYHQQVQDLQRWKTEQTPKIGALNEENERLSVENSRLTAANEASVSKLFYETELSRLETAKTTAVRTAKEKLIKEHDIASSIMKQNLNSKHDKENKTHADKVAKFEEENSNLSDRVKWLSDNVKNHAVANTELKSQLASAKVMHEGTESNKNQRIMTLENDLSQSKRKNTELANENDSLRATSEDNAVENHQLTDQLTEMKRQLAEKDRQIYQIQEQLNHAKANIESLQTSNDRLAGVEQDYKVLKHEQLPQMVVSNNELKNKEQQLLKDVETARKNETGAKNQKNRLVEEQARRDAQHSMAQHELLNIVLPAIPELACKEPVSNNMLKNILAKPSQNVTPSASVDSAALAWSIVVGSWRTFEHCIIDEHTTRRLWLCVCTHGSTGRILALVELAAAEYQEPFALTLIISTCRIMLQRVKDTEMSGSDGVHTVLAAFRCIELGIRLRADLRELDDIFKQVVQKWNTGTAESALLFVFAWWLDLALTRPGSKSTLPDLLEQTDFQRITEPFGLRRTMIGCEIAIVVNRATSTVRVYDWSELEWHHENFGDIVRFAAQPRADGAVVNENDFQLDLTMETMEWAVAYLGPQISTRYEQTFSGLTSQMRRAGL